MTSIVVSKLDSQKDQPLDFTRSVQVIGCGLGRKGINSFSTALETLLSGPVYHSGTAILGGDEDTIQTWTAILQQNPKPDPAFVKASHKKLLAGYVGLTDTPIALFTPELCELYPDAKSHLHNSQCRFLVAELAGHPDQGAFRGHERAALAFPDVQVSRVFPRSAGDEDAE